MNVCRLCVRAVVVIGDCDVCSIFFLQDIHTSFLVLISFHHWWNVFGIWSWKQIDIIKLIYFFFSFV